ncbi:MAG: hypothetical protein M3680_11150 [Myxococcota bacterium]|nr:hypothetical protein [Myxococcota bacterium]
MITCDHPGERSGVCRHLLADSDLEHLEHFTGRRAERVLVCRACAAALPGDLAQVCATCRDHAAEGGCAGITGTPEIVDAASSLRFEHLHIELGGPALLDIQPVLGGDRCRWIGLDGDGRLHAIDLDRRTTVVVAGLPPEAIELTAAVVMRVSPDGRLVAIANRHGRQGIVLDLDTRLPALTLLRDDYQHGHSDFPLAFLERGGRQLLVHATAWNRLEVVDARTGALLTAREIAPYERDGPRPEHYLDYFHCGLAISPGQRSIADNGWVWAPVGIVTAWSLERWLDANPWESEDGPSRRELGWRDYYWDGPLCWLDDDRLAIYGYGNDDQWLVPAAQIFDVRTGARTHWFPGPQGTFVFDRFLFALAHNELTVWDVERGTRLARAPAAAAVVRYHPTARTFITLPGPGVTVMRLRGHHADAAWNTGIVTELARTIARDRSFDELPVLGDALEAAGCTDGELLAHCQHPGEHGERCWVLERLLR